MCKVHWLFGLLAVVMCAGGSVQEKQDFPRRDTVRTWSDSSGKFSRQAKFVRLENGTVTLLKSDGKETSLPLDRLSETDQKIAQCFGTPARDPECEVILGDVVDVHDGDTIKFQTVLGETISVRLTDIDAPELGQRFGRDATDELRRVTLNKARTGPASIETKEKDRYGRILGTLYIDGTDINKHMVELGFAWNFDKYSKRPELEDLEDSARRGKKGLWSAENPEPPWEFRDGREAKTYRRKLDEGRAAAKANSSKSSEAGESRQPQGLMAQPDDAEAESDLGNQIADDPIVYVTKTGDKYHTAGCSHLRKSKIPMPLSEASQGHSPCSQCNPPR